TGQIRRVLQEDPSEFDPRKYLNPAMTALTKLCKDRFEHFGTAGMAGRITPLPVSEMAKLYKSGSLDPAFS
ncbi:fructose-1,6-bisphosphate aldolase, partial [Rhizobium johnstonii]